MFHSIASSVVALAMSSLYIQFVKAYFDPCSGNDCHHIQAPVNAACGVDPNDGSTFAYAFGVCPFINNEHYTLAVTYTGVDGSRPR